MWGTTGLYIRPFLFLNYIKDKLLSTGRSFTGDTTHTQRSLP